MSIEEIIFPQDINLSLTVKVNAGADGVASIDVPSELRITEQVFLLLTKLVEEQGLKLGNMNIFPVHVAEVNQLSSVSVVEKTP